MPQKEFKDLKVGAMSAEQAFAAIQKAGVSEVDASLLVSDWIRETILGGRRRFDYRTPFPGVEEDCGVTFTRSFAHVDWVDGESVVQAEETPSEEGFNERFHRIEDDLDALGAGLAKLSACMAEMRLGLRSLLDEIKAEVNRLDAARGDEAGPAIARPPSAILKQPPVYVGTTQYFDQMVHVWETEAGVITLPSVDPVALAGAGNLRVQRVQALAKLVADDKRIEEAIDKGVTKEALVEELGDVRAEDGQSLAGLIDILPADAKFTSADALVASVSEREAAALRTAPSGTEPIAASLGPNAAGASVERLGIVPEGAREALHSVGIDTVAKLAAASPKTIADAAVVKQPGATVADAAGWQAAASMLIQLGAGGG
ncbi:MAG TPA: hypothetical protein VF245_06915 [Solirubrobacterales bacterium]